jgi:hypothetical protein
MLKEQLDRLSAAVKSGEEASAALKDYLAKKAKDVSDTATDAKEAASSWWF